jgi:hypothetical protein
VKNYSSDQANNYSSDHANNYSSDQANKWFLWMFETLHILAVPRQCNTSDITAVWLDASTVLPHL